jgi:hypothetical protein
LNLRNHSQSLSGRNTALAPGGIGKAEAGSLSKVEAAGDEELWVRAAAVVQDCAGSIHDEIQCAAVAELRNGAVTLNKAGLAGNLSFNEALGNAA